MARQETFCATFCRQASCTGDPDSQPCVVCGWNREEHVTIEELEAATAKREARLIVDRGRFRLYIYRGFRYKCGFFTVELWQHAAGNRASDYRGTRSFWKITDRTPDSGVRRRRKVTAPPPAPEEVAHEQTA